MRVTVLVSQIIVLCCLSQSYALRFANRLVTTRRSASSLNAVTDDYLSKLNAGKELAITMDGSSSCVAASSQNVL